MKNIKWTLEKLKKAAIKYNTRNEFNLKNKGAYLSAYRQGILDEVCSHMKIPENRPRTLSYLMEEALKYKTRGEFQKYSRLAYQTAFRRKILSQICAHMVEARHVWSYKELRVEALKYKTRIEFQTKNNRAYQSAENKGVLDKICSHMKRSLTISMQESFLFNLIKEKYPEAKTLRDKRVKISNKPHIKGFEIDVYIPELRRGIEFDGKYWHSFKFMRGDPKKSKWSDEDIRNYHEIKDSWFASKSIQILHIKEEDWDKDKEECIKKCLRFLGGIT